MTRLGRKGEQGQGARQGRAFPLEWCLPCGRGWHEWELCEVAAVSDGVQLQVVFSDSGAWRVGTQSVAALGKSWCC